MTSIVKSWTTDNTVLTFVSAECAKQPLSVGQKDAFLLYNTPNKCLFGLRKCHFNTFTKI